MVKVPGLLILASLLAVAGCSGAANSSNSADTSSAASQAPAAASSEAPASGEAVSALPLYPGAKKSALGNMKATKCGHKESVETYTVKADPKTVLDWYAARIPGGIQIDASGLAHAQMTSHEIVAADGSGAVGVTQVKPGLLTAAQGGGGIFIGIGTYDPPMNSAELQTMQAIFSKDPAAKKQAIAEMSARCGPASVKAFQ
jgi:hypothetical protein